MTEDEAGDAIVRREAWTLDKARRILTGWPLSRDDLAAAPDVTLGVAATLGVGAVTVTVHRGGREVTNFSLNLMTWSDDELAHWKATHQVGTKPRPKLRLVQGGKVD